MLFGEDVMDIDDRDKGITVGESGVKVKILPFWSASIGNGQCGIILQTVKS